MRNKFRNDSNIDLQLIKVARREAAVIPPGVSSRMMLASTSADESCAREVRLNSLSGYRILREIHRGGQGVVYQAIQETTERLVAIKIPREGPFADKLERGRFAREVRILAQLRHPNIVAIHDTGQTSGSEYFVMDYVEGQPLDVYVTSRVCSIEETLCLFRKICDAVAAAHLRGIIHRDLKPGNIRVDDNGEPYVLDFGLAKVESNDETQSVLTQTGQFIGSLPWASPEQAQGVPGDVDVRSDVYSLGVVLYQMLTGKFPYTVIGSTRDVLDRIINAEPIRPRLIRRGVNDEVETIVLKCIAKDRARRYQTAAELAADVGRYLAGKPIEAKRDSLWYVARKSLRHHRVAAGFLTVVAAAIMFGVIMTYWTAAERTARFVANEKLLIERSEKIEDRERLGRLISLIANGVMLVDEEKAAAEELFADYAQRLRAGELSKFEVEQIARFLTTIEVRGRKLTNPEVGPALSLKVGTRRGFWLPDIAFAISVEPLLDNTAVTEGVKTAQEMYAEHGGGVSSGWNLRGQAPENTVGSHLLSGEIIVRFIERTSHISNCYTRPYDASATDRDQAPIVLAECRIPIPPFRFTVSESVKSGLASFFGTTPLVVSGWSNTDPIGRFPGGRRGSSCRRRWRDPTSCPYASNATSDSCTWLPWGRNRCPSHGPKPADIPPSPNAG